MIEPIAFFYDYNELIFWLVYIVYHIVYKYVV